MAMCVPEGSLAPAPSKSELAEIRTRSAGRCECTGQCGHNHQWEAFQEATRCKVPHNTRIRRRLGRESCWVYVAQPEGVQFDVAFEEEYGDNEQAKLGIVEVGGKLLAMCGFCTNEQRKGNRYAADRPSPGGSDQTGGTPRRRPRPKVDAHLVEDSGSLRGKY
jgi:hypothetical protein